MSNPVLQSELFERAVCNFGGSVDQMQLFQRWFDESVGRLESVQQSFSRDVDRLLEAREIDRAAVRSEGGDS